MTYKRFSIFPNDRGRGIPVQSSEPPGPIAVFMDESGNGNPDQPLIVGAVVADLQAGDVEEEIRLLHRELSARRTFRGRADFEKFRKSGFHASTDPLEIRPRFIEFIQRGSGFKIYLAAISSGSRQGLAENQLISEMYQILIADILLQHRSQSVITVCIEDNVGLRRTLQEVPNYATMRAQLKQGQITKLPEIRMELAVKGSIMTLAIADYAMLIVSQWMGIACKNDLGKKEYRALREIEPSISLLYLLDDRVKLDRKMHSDIP